VRWIHHIYLRGIDTLWGWNSARDDSPLIKRLIAIRDRLIRLEGSVEAAKLRISSWADGERMVISMGYDFFRKKGPKLCWPGTVWNSWVTPKHAVTLWLAARRRLPTKDRLSFLQLEEQCVLCVGNRESAAHLFFACEFSRTIWTRIRAWLNISRLMTTIDSALKWIKKESRGSGCNAKARCVALACTVYHIWSARNRRIFEGRTVDVEGIALRLKLHVYRTIYSLFTQSGVDQ